MRRLWKYLALAVALSATLGLCACQPPAGPAAQTSKAPAAGKEAPAIPPAISGNPVNDARYAAAAGDYRFKAIRDEHGAPVVPNASRLKAAEYGYAYEFTLVYSASAGKTPAELTDKIYYYAANYNNELLSQMRAAPRKTPEPAVSRNTPPASAKVVKPRSSK